jgi:hypothetical protein
MWISKLMIDLIDCTIALAATRDPERADFSLTLQFREVGNVQITRYHDDLQHPPCLGDFTPIRAEDLEDGRVRFHINTGDALLVFEACAEPNLSLLDNSQITYADFFTRNNTTVA